MAESSVTSLPTRLLVFQNETQAHIGIPPYR